MKRLIASGLLFAGFMGGLSIAACAGKTSSTSTGSSGNQQTNQTAGGQTIPACTWPPGADTYSDASATGCRPRSVFEICGVPNGSVVYPDGAVVSPDGAPAQCSDACSATDYSLSCIGDGETGNIPSPDPSLDCTIVPVPTPSDVLFYCCPCGS